MTQERKLKFFDAHTHVQFRAFDSDYKEVIGRALKMGVGMVNVGTQKDTSARAVEVAHEYENENIFAVVGLHPIHTSKSFHDAQELGGGEAAKAFTSRGEEFDHEYYKKLAGDPKVVAIGECGLDYFRLNGDAVQAENEKKAQKEAFLGQMELAREVRKPLMIHCRAAFSDLIAILYSARRPLPANPGIINFFSGSKDEAKKLLDMGFYFTFGGVITFPPKAGRRAGDYDETIKMIPSDKILSETDAPYVAPVPYRGKRNEPAYVEEVAKKLAELRGVSVEKMAEQILDNSQKVFNINLT